MVDCEYRAKGADEVDLAVCRADGKDIGADLVRAGLAWSNGSQSRDYVVDEGFAMSGVRGVHARVCRLPPVLLSNLLLAFAYAAFGRVAEELQLPSLAIAVSIAAPVLMIALFRLWLLRRKST